MTLITCEFDCKYQKDGYCDLNSNQTFVTNSNNEINCIHYIKKGNDENIKIKEV